MPSLSNSQSLGVKIATPVGALIGQLLFGWLADVVGCKRMCMFPAFSPSSSSCIFIDGIELIIIIVGTFAQALSANGEAVKIIGVLVVWRVLVSLRSSYPPLIRLTSVSIP